MNYYIDQDGVLAVYVREHYQGYNPIWDKPGTHYFRHREPHETMVDVLNTLYDRKKNPKNSKLNIDRLFILSSVCTHGSLFNEHLADKKRWIVDYCPAMKDDIDKIFKPSFINKVTMATTLKGSSLDLHDVLIDDYQQNLDLWTKAGGLAIKYINGINSHESHSGLYITSNMTHSEIITYLENVSVALNVL